MRCEKNEGKLHIPRELTPREQYWRQLEREREVEVPHSLILHSDYVNFIPAKAYILDIGCGTGEKLSSLVGTSDIGRRTGFGIDINPYNIRSAKAFAEKNIIAELVDFEVANGAELYFIRNAFDCALEIGVFGGIELGEDKAIAREAFRLIKPGGTFAAAEFELDDKNPEQKKRYQEDEQYLRYHKMAGKYGDRIVWKNKKKEEIFFIGTHFRKEELVGLLKEAGFKDIQSRMQHVVSDGVGDGSIKKARPQLTVWGTKPQ